MILLAASDALSALATRFSGQLLQENDAGYDAARRVHNGLVDKRPALIARCRNAADVVDAVNLAGEHGLEIAVRGGGHNPAGRGTIDGGLLIDLSLMKGIHVDPKARVARAQGGVTWGEYNRETQMHGLASTGGIVSTTGIGGLTLGGGLGWLQGKYGLAVDNLRSLQLVTADGHIVSANENEHASLFWAARGGGGNFGVATSLEYDVHPVGPMVTGGLVAHPFARAREMLRFFRAVTTSIDDELTLFGALLHAPDGSNEKLAAIVACHCGTPDAGRAATQPLKAFGQPVMDAIGPLPYTAMNQMLDAAYPKGVLNYWKSSFLSDLSDEAIDLLVDSCCRCAEPSEHSRSLRRRHPRRSALRRVRAPRRPDRARGARGRRGPG